MCKAFIHLFFRYLLRFCQEPGTVLCAKDTAGSGAKFLLLELPSWQAATKDKRSRQMHSGFQGVTSAAKETEQDKERAREGGGEVANVGSFQKKNRETETSETSV